MKYSLPDLKKAIELVEDVSEQIENLGNLFTRLEHETFTHLSKEEKETIDASRECHGSLLDVVRTLGELEVTMEEEVGEDS